MANIGEITQAAYYQGNTALGGGVAGAFVPDLSAFQRLSDYTYMTKQAEFTRKYAEFKDNAKQVADATKIDWSKIRPEHAKVIHDKESELKDFIRANPAASQQSGSPAFLKFHTLANELKELTEAGGMRSVEYAATAKKIADTAPDGTTLKKWMDDLDAKYAKNDIYTPLNPFEEFRTKPIDWTGPAAILARDHVEPNYIRHDKYTGLDYGQIEAQASSLPLNIDKMQVGYDKWEHLQRMAGSYNQLFKDGVLKDPAYTERDKNGKFIRFTQKAISDPVYGGILRTVDGWNKGVTDYNNSSVGVPANPIDVDSELTEIDMRKLMASAMMARKVEQTLTYHGAADTKAENAANRANARSIAATRSSGGGSGGGQQVSLYTELGSAYQGAKASPNAQEVNGTVFVPFNELDEGVKTRMTNAMQDRFGYNPKTGKSNAENLYIGVRSDGSVVIGEKQTSGKVTATNTITQNSLDVLDLNALKLTSPDFKALPTGGSGPAVTSSGLPILK